MVMEGKMIFVRKGFEMRVIKGSYGRHFVMRALVKRALFLYSPEIYFGDLCSCFEM
jgi:hypothetical protein